MIKMHAKIKKILILPILLLVIISFVDARKGVGLSWSTETELVNENKVHCIDYGLYNPWDEDVYAILSTSDELSSIVSVIERDSMLIKAGTSSSNAIPVRICFEVKKIYKESCILGMMCEKKCEETQAEYSGQIIVKEKVPDTLQGSGSSVALDVAAPLKIKVTCEKTERSYTPLIIILITLILLILIGWFLIKKKRGYTPQQYPVYK